MAEKNIKKEIINRIYSFPQDNLNLLRSKTFLKPLIKLMIRDALLSEVELDDDLTNQLCDRFFKRINIDSEDKKINYFRENLLNDNDLKAIATSTEKANKMSLKLFGEKSSEFFEKRKSQLDQYIYSFIKVKDSNLAQELFLKIESNENDFSSVASEYSEGPEKYKKGLIGPVPFSKINPQIRAKFSSGEKGIVYEPFELSGFWVILRLEEILPAKYDEKMKTIMSNELFELMVEKFTREIIAEITKFRFKDLIPEG